MSNNEMVSIKSIFEASPTGRTVRDDLSARQRLRHSTDTGRYSTQLLRSGKKIDAAEFHSIWKALDEAGIGRYIVGRGGKPNRFEWSYSLKDVAKAASEGTPTKELAPFNAKKKLPKAPRPVKRQSVKARPLARVATTKVLDSITLTMSLSPKISNQDLTALIDLINEVNQGAK